ncbi:PEBP-like protein [Coniochaeta ligniaria NRRL 30616]|uniref:PEBP-like protein n=1 Tax=Coniochaeta ligniaria NRRL 30616 TaxID=1408157 RepID=A0A1J7I4D4_9PEZI|nr:PEBP-like protein [Coniochaeta ligniaria NRRL 30616]
MLKSIVASVLVFVGLAHSETPPGFTPEAVAHLDVIFGTKAVSPPGTSLTKADTQKQPTIGTSDTILNGTYPWLMMDLDVPASFTNPSAGPRRTNLHAMITGFKSTGQKTETGINTLTSTATGPVKYVGPAPPAETPPHAHRYVELLFETNATFTVPQSYVQQTLGFDLQAFVQKAGLAPPVRGNWFNVTG